jgi:hypothetical protein
LAYVPRLEYGLPTRWVTQFDVEYYNGRARDIHGEVIPTEYKDGDFKGAAIDPNDPPVYESQASYLKRNGLLTRSEKSYLKAHPELLQPEKIELETE